MGCTVVFLLEGLAWEHQAGPLVALFRSCCVGISRDWAHTWFTWLYFSEPTLPGAPYPVLSILQPLMKGTLGSMMQLYLVF